MSSDYCKPHLLLTVHSVGLVVSRQKHATMMSEEDWRDDEELIEGQWLSLAGAASSTIVEKNIFFI